MNLTKRFILIILPLIVISTGYTLYHSSSETETIDKLVVSIQKEGLIVTPTYISLEEKATTEKIKNSLTQLQNSAGMKPDQSKISVEDQLLNVGGIQGVHFYRFPSEQAASEYYTTQNEIERHLNDDAVTRAYARPSKSEYLQAGKTLVLRIDHFDLDTKDVEFDINNVHVAEPPTGDLTKLRSIAANWK